MARGKKVDPAGSDSGVAWSDDGAQGDSNDPASALASMLDGLDQHAEVSITREQPGYAAGFVGTWEIHDRDPISFLERLQGECGGSVYYIRPLRREVNGRKLYARGSRRVRISGPPLSEGRRWGADSGPPVIDTTAVHQQQLPRPGELAPVPQNFLGILETLATRLANIEARQQQQQPFGAMQPPPPPRDPITTTVETMAAFAKLQKMIGGMQPQEVFVDDDEDEDEEPQGPPGIEDMIAMVIAKKYDLDAEGNPTPKPEAAPAAAGGPRLIRDGADVTNAGTTTTAPTAAPTATAGAPTQAPAAEQQQGPEAVARIIAAQGPEEAVNFLLRMTEHLPPDIQAGLQRAAMAQMQTPGDGNGTEG